MKSRHLLVKQAYNTLGALSPHHQRRRPGALSASPLRAPMNSPVPPGSEPAELRLATRSGSQTVVQICGEMDIQSAAKLRDELLRVVHQHGPQITLDLMGVTFLDCAGVNVLVRPAAGPAWRTAGSGSPGPRPRYGG